MRRLRCLRILERTLLWRRRRRGGAVIRSQKSLLAGGESGPRYLGADTGASSGVYINLLGSKPPNLTFRPKIQTRIFSQDCLSTSLAMQTAGNRGMRTHLGATVVDTSAYQHWQRFQRWLFRWVTTTGDHPHPLCCGCFRRTRSIVKHVCLA